MRRREKGSFMSSDDALSVQPKPDEDKTLDAAPMSACEIADVITRRLAMFKRARNLPEASSVYETASSPAVITITPPMMPPVTPSDPRPRAASSIYGAAPSPTAMTLAEPQSPGGPAPRHPAPPPVATKRFAPQQPLLQQSAPLRYREDFVALLADGESESRAERIKRMRLANPTPEIAPELLPPTKRGRGSRAALLAGAALATMLGTASWAFWQFGTAGSPNWSAIPAAVLAAIGTEFGSMGWTVRGDHYGGDAAAGPGGDASDRGSASAGGGAPGDGECHCRGARAAACSRGDVCERRAEFRPTRNCR